MSSLYGMRAPAGAGTTLMSTALVIYYATFSPCHGVIDSGLTYLPRLDDYSNA